jgi:hypothetical protein
MLKCSSSWVSRQKPTPTKPKNKNKKAVRGLDKTADEQLIKPNVARESNKVGTVVSQFSSCFPQIAFASLPFMSDA